MSGSHGETINVTLKVWRQTSADAPGGFETHQQAISTDASFLEMLDLLNEELNAAGKEPIAFESDCREGICGTCGVMINGRAHGPQKATATCQLHMREFADDDEIVIEPFRATGFPVIRDLAVDRSPLDAIIEAGGYISVNTGAASDANLTPVPKVPTVHLRQDRPPGPAAPGPGRTLEPNRGHGRDHGGVLRVVHKPRRMHRGLPQGDQPRLHRPDEP